MNAAPAELLPRKGFIRVNAWSNERQRYEDVGTLLYGRKEDSTENPRYAVGFEYDTDYIKALKPAIDPSKLVPNRERGMYVEPGNNGDLPAYFRACLPGEFAQRLISVFNTSWDNLNDVERLYVATLAHGDHGYLQLNAQLDQRNDPVTDLESLQKLVAIIRGLQRADNSGPIPESLRGAACSLSGRRPKIDYAGVNEGVAHRFIVRLNSLDNPHEAAASAFVSGLAREAHLWTVPQHTITLPGQEQVLFSQNYARQDSLDDSGSVHITRYNRISIKALLDGDPQLSNIEKPCLDDVARVIKMHSDNPKSDLASLYQRTVFDVATGHCDNGLDNIEMMDTGRGRWRLGPIFHTTPSVSEDASYEVMPIRSIATRNALSINVELLETLGESCELDRTLALDLALPVLSAVAGAEAKLAGLPDLADASESISPALQTGACADTLKAIAAEDEYTPMRMDPPVLLKDAGAPVIANLRPSAGPAPGL